MIARLLLIAFIESLASTFVQRGVYFYTAERAGFTPGENLWLALAMGVAYVAGAVMSHASCRRIGEKRQVALTIGVQCLTHLTLAISPTAVPLFVGTAIIGWLNGLKWPVVESYVAAGLSPSQQARAVGRFNVAWATAIPLGLAMAGPLIDFDWPPQVPGGLFLMAAVLNLTSFCLLRPLPGKPIHMAADHPQRPDAHALVRLGGLLTSSRWLMVSSYVSSCILSPLMPHIFHRLGQPVTTATALTGLLDLVRLGAFIALGWWTAWHGRRRPLVASMAGLLAGFFAVLFAPDIAERLGGGEAIGMAIVLAGEAVFGLAAGMVYYASLYYAMVVKNASVDAGGAHEGIIGMGLAIGPAAGLAGIALAGTFGAIGGQLVGIAPLLAICTAMAVGPLVRIGKHKP